MAFKAKHINFQNSSFNSLKKNILLTVTVWLSRIKDRNMWTAKYISFNERMGRYADHITEICGKK